MPPPRIPDTSSHSSSEEGSQQAPTIGSDRVLDKDLDMVHDRNCKVRMVGRFLLRNILAVGDILWAYSIPLAKSYRAIGKPANATGECYSQWLENRIVCASRKVSKNNQWIKAWFDYFVDPKSRKLGLITSGLQISSCLQAGSCWMPSFSVACSYSPIRT